MHIFCRAPNVFCAVRGDFFQNKRQTVTFFRFFDILLLRADGERIYRRDAKCEGKEAAAATRGTYGSDICLRASHKLLLPAEISCRGACDMGYYSRLLRQTVLIIFSGGLFCEGCFI